MSSGIAFTAERRKWIDVALSLPEGRALDATVDWIVTGGHLAVCGQCIGHDAVGGGYGCCSCTASPACGGGHIIPPGDGLPPCASTDARSALLMAQEASRRCECVAVSLQIDGGHLCILDPDSKAEDPGGRLMSVQHSGLAFAITRQVLLSLRQAGVEYAKKEEQPF